MGSCVPTHFIFGMFVWFGARSYCKTVWEEKWNFSISLSDWHS